MYCMRMACGQLCCSCVVLWLRCAILPCSQRAMAAQVLGAYKSNPSPFDPCMPTEEEWLSERWSPGCWHCRALCQRVCSREDQIWTYCRIWEDGSVGFTGSADVSVTAHDWGSIFSQIVKPKNTESNNIKKSSWNLSTSVLLLNMWIISTILFIFLWCKTYMILKCSAIFFIHTKPIQDKKFSRSVISMQIVETDLGLCIVRLKIWESVLKFEQLLYKWLCRTFSTTNIT